MNKQIRELADQAKMSTYLLAYGTEFNMAMERFAQLIVHECAQFVEDKFDFCGDEILIKQKMLEHFGVVE